ncbi:MAG: glucan 1,4-alpha-glucosidase [Candidatus Hydrogenedentes bacterium]|nr:glucan 1,4-alpha-glucosidase [Candidatus Hydrogenedentota bacterium]
MGQEQVYAPGWPGIPPRWTSSAKTGIGAALSPGNQLWFTVSHGIVNEVYFPRIDLACTRDMGLVVTDGREFFSEEKRHAKSKVNYQADGAPIFRLVNTCKQGRYRIEKEILTDPRHPVLLQRIRFQSTEGGKNPFHLYVLVAPHLGNRGYGNTGWVDEYKGIPMVFAERNGNALALACSAPWLNRSVGFVGFSDAWQDLTANKDMTWAYTRAENGNIALAAEIDVQSDEAFVLALGFGRNAAEAGNRARTSLQDGFDAAQTQYAEQWKTWQDSLLPMDDDPNEKQQNLYRVSTIVLRAHEAAEFPGGVIASLSVPWGFSKGDDDLGGYHLVWPRDLVEAAGGLLAVGAHQAVRRVITYLQATQEADGHWAQNMWLDGSPYWNAIQMDETALPILLVDLARRQLALDETDVARFWPMVRQAAAYLVANGPVSPQDRWEEDPGYSPFTLGAEIAALLAAADLAGFNHEPSIAAYLREVADVWNASIDRLMYVSNTGWCQKLDVPGYYVRIAPVDVEEEASRFQRTVDLKSASPDECVCSAVHLVGPDALALVRFGLRAANDPRILATVQVIDALTRVETPTGPMWVRYNGDRYGEHEDGAPFNGSGIGRAWPLLTGERAHYEIAAGNLEDAKRLLNTLESFANEGGMMPEQIWNAPDIPKRELYFGRPSGSAMPLVWTHAEYVKLRRSLRDGRVFDTPPQTVKRYLVEKTPCPRIVWRFNHKIRSMPAGRALRIETLAPAIIHWSLDGWSTVQDMSTHDTGLTVHIADLPTQTAADGRQVSFTFYWPDAGHWEGTDFAVRISTPAK